MIVYLTVVTLASLGSDEVKATCRSDDRTIPGDSGNLVIFCLPRDWHLSIGDKIRLTIEQA